MGRPAAACPRASRSDCSEVDAVRTGDERPAGTAPQRVSAVARARAAADPTLLTNQPYLQPYPALVTFLTEHPEIAHNPVFYLGNDNPEQLPTRRRALLGDSCSGCRCRGRTPDCARFPDARQEREQRGIGLQIRLIGQERRIQPQHPQQRRRILVEEPFELLFGFLSGLRGLPTVSSAGSRTGGAGPPTRPPRPTGR